jgi:hypothetical protein
MYISHKKIVSKTAEKSEREGRGKNGMAFIYNSDIKLNSAIEFYGNRIGVMQLETVVIIGVYMCYNNGKQSSRDELQEDTELIIQLIKQFKSKGKEVVIVGDFNVDFSRINPFTRVLIDFLVETDYIVADIEYGSQLIDYIWHSIRYEDKEKKKPYIITSWVDHLLVSRKSTTINYVEIIKSDCNKGDHNCIRFILKSKELIVDKCPVKIKPLII